MRHIILSFLLISSLLLNGKNREEYASYNLRAPLDIPLLLSGNFGELRPHHFHAGLDFKTQGHTGLPVYAVADGYVSRINMSTSGYGRALYIDHPKLGLTTVYAHLNEYAPQIDSMAKAKHYELEKYNINFFPDHKVWVTKGEIIAYSGNTGSSAGPHLHFEIRDRQTQDPINPLLFGFDIKDSMNPAINGLRIYPFNNEGVINHESDKSNFFSVVYYAGKYHLKGDPTINAWGKIGFSINTLDYLDGSWSKCSIYAIELLVDSLPIFKQEMDRISYAEMRYVDAHVDQKIRNAQRVDYQYSFQAKPNNPLSIYKEMRHDGIVNMTDSAVHLITYRVKDTYGNTSILEFHINGKRQAIAEKTKTNKLKWNESHQFSANQFQLLIPKNAFYEDQTLDYTINNDSQYLSPVFEIHNDNKLLNKAATVSIRPNPNSTIPIDKMVICKVRDKGELDFQPSELKNGSLSTKVYSFSAFTISCDTIAPKLKPVNIYDGKRFDNTATFGFKVNDDFTGLWDYSATIDGHWALFFYEYKKDYIYYTIDPSRLEKGKKHQLKFEAWDATENKTKYSCNFFW